MMVVANDVFVRRTISDALAADGRFGTVTVAATGKIALAKQTQSPVDGVVLCSTLDDERIEQVVAQLRENGPDLFIAVMSSTSSLARSRVERALKAGADLEVQAPGREGDKLGALVADLARGLTRTRAGGARAVERAPAKPAKPGPVRIETAPRAPVKRSKRPIRLDLLAIGSSTGGPRALEEVVLGLSADFPVPVVITQHMPPVFTKNLAQQLDRKAQVHVREAEEGDVLDPGTVYIAPGDYHMEIVHRAARFEVHLQQGAPENSCRPAVDVMLRSIVRCFGGNVLTVILTGMGQDGLRGCESIKEVGGTVYVQDEDTSVVWGMPGFVAKAGLADKVLPLHGIAAEIERRAWIGRERSILARQRVGKKAV